jgi:hypothetical protein
VSVKRRTNQIGGFPGPFPRGSTRNVRQVSCPPISCTIHTVAWTPRKAWPRHRQNTKNKPQRASNPPAGGNRLLLLAPWQNPMTECAFSRQKRQLTWAENRPTSDALGALSPIQLMADSPTTDRMRNEAAPGSWCCPVRCGSGRAGGFPEERDVDITSMTLAAQSVRA